MTESRELAELRYHWGAAYQLAVWAAGGERSAGTARVGGSSLRTRKRYTRRSARTTSGTP